MSRSLDDWPQRLLHVPTMTSHEWQERHRYGTHVQPRYNAISYTWGRYELRSPHEQPHVKPIGINRVTWAVPRIDETHFTVDQFETLIRRSTETTTFKGNNPAFTTNRKPTEFVWLDIACINQTPDHPQKAQEIGRQSQIFKKATKVLIWLNRSSRELLEDATESITQAAANASTDISNINPGQSGWKSVPGSGSLRSFDICKRWLASRAVRLQSNLRQVMTSSSATVSRSVLTGQEPWLTIATTGIKSLTENRWFSSLWTLQEAFLCQWAYLVSQEVEAIHQDSPQLHTIFSSCKTLSTMCKRNIASKTVLGLPTTSIELELIKLLERTGLAALEAENPMALYTVASNRVTLRPEDRIYGIMQVFGFRLGISDPGIPRNSARMDLPELELQLGQQLIKSYPLISQLHVHTLPTGFGQAWKVTNSSRIPELVSKVDFRILRSTIGQHTSLCDLSLENIAGTCWGLFSGKLTPFEKLKKAWFAADSRIGRGKKGRSIQQVALDSTDLIPDQTFTEDYREDLPRNHRQHRLTAEMANYFRRARLTAMVLLLGRFTDDQHTDEWWELSGGPIPDETGDRFLIGMILVRQEDCSTGFWRRLGICIWDLSQPMVGDAGQKNALLEGESTDWLHHEGIYG
ncbi:MAG: hypothetical protein Q9226_007772 [Calogaya cf. arnoldii]